MKHKGDCNKRRPKEASVSATKAPAATTKLSKKRKMLRDLPGVTARTAAKAKAVKASATVDAAVPEIPKNLVEIWKVPVS